MDTVELAEQLIKTETETPIENEEKFKTITRLLEEHGIEYNIHEFEGVKSLTATVGSGNPHICFNGHMDVVPAGDNWKKTGAYEPKEIDGKLYGRGSSDMKGGLAAKIVAFLRLHESDNFNGKLTLMVPGDEEQGGRRGTEQLLQENDNYDYTLIAEPTDMKLQVGFRGKCHLDVILKGESCHASRPHLAENVLEKKLQEAIEALSNLEWEEDDTDIPETTSVVTQVETYNPQNSVPEKVRIGMDIRFDTAQNRETIKRKVEQAMPDHLEYEVVIDHVKPCVMVEDKDFTSAVDEATEEVVGKKPVHTTEGGSSDGAHFSRHDIPSLEIGPIQEPIHAPDEYCHIEDLQNLEEIFYRTAVKLSRKENKVLREEKV